MVRRDRANGQPERRARKDSQKGQRREMVRKDGGKDRQKQEPRKPDRVERISPFWVGFIGGPGIRRKASPDSRSVPASMLVWFLSLKKRRLVHLDTHVHRKMSTVRLDEGCWRASKRNISYLNLQFFYFSMFFEGLDSWLLGEFAFYVLLSCWWQGWMRRDRVDPY